MISEEEMMITLSFDTNSQLGVNYLIRLTFVNSSGG